MRDFIVVQADKDGTVLCVTPARAGSPAEAVAVVKDMARRGGPVRGRFTALDRDSAAQYGLRWEP